MTESLSLREARRIALAAQGFGQRRSAGRSSWRRVESAIAEMGLLQIDSISVLVRAHYLPAFSRVGSYDTAQFDRRAFQPRWRAFFEYWGHEASLLPLSSYPFFRWRMARAERLEGIYGGIAKFARERRAYVNTILAEIRDGGPSSAKEFECPRKASGWWEWHDAKLALEYLFWCGKITTAARRGFQRVYDLTERVIPAEILARPVPSEAESQRELLRVAGRALGVATEADLRDYFRLPAADAKARVLELVDSGDLLPVTVEGWRQPAYLDPKVSSPRTVRAAALLSPFDPLVWERARTERLFGFRYRLEVYTPAPKRQYGYYVLPFLLNEKMVARVDLKAERANGTLRVLAAHREPRMGRQPVPRALAAELWRLAGWLELDRVEVKNTGDLAAALRTEMESAAVCPDRCTG